MDQTAAPWRALDAPETAPSPPAEERSTTSPWFAVVCLVVAGVLAIAAFLVAAGGLGRPDLVVEGATTSGEGPLASGAGAPVAAAIVVEVGGAVTRPGVYELEPGARIADAIAAAGGYGPRVDVGRADREINLAAPVVDGAEIHVPSRDDPAPAAAASSEGGAGGGAAGGATGGVIDLNRATAAELEALPGIGPATAAKIIAAREERPFATLDELRERKVLGPATLEKVRNLVTVGP